VVEVVVESTRVVVVVVVSSDAITDGGRDVVVTIATAATAVSGTRSSPAMTDPDIDVDRLIGPLAFVMFSSWLVTWNTQCGMLR
jgi:hypothetical protein